MGTQAALPLSAQDDGPHHPLHKAGEIKRVGRGAPPRERKGRVGVADHGTNNMERRKRKLGSTGVFCCWQTSSLNLVPYWFWGLKGEHVTE